MANLILFPCVKSKVLNSFFWKKLSISCREQLRKLLIAHLPLHEKLVATKCLASLSEHLRQSAKIFKWASCPTLTHSISIFSRNLTILYSVVRDAMIKITIETCFSTIKASSLRKSLNLMMKRTKVENTLEKSTLKALSHLTSASRSLNPWNLLLSLNRLLQKTRLLNKRGIILKQNLLQRPRIREEITGMANLSLSFAHLLVLLSKSLISSKLCSTLLRLTNSTKISSQNREETSQPISYGLHLWKVLIASLKVKLVFMHSSWLTRLKKISQRVSICKKTTILFKASLKKILARVVLET